MKFAVSGWVWSGVMLGSLLQVGVGVGLCKGRCFRFGSVWGRVKGRRGVVASGGVDMGSTSQVGSHQGLREGRWLRLGSVWGPPARSPARWGRIKGRAMVVASGWGWYKVAQLGRQ